MLRLDHLRLGEDLRWLWPLPVSIKDWWVGPREQVLNVPITCQWYGPGKSSSRPSTENWLCPHCFNSYTGRETGYEPADQLAGVLFIMSGAPFLESSGPAQLCWWLCERLLCVDRVRYIWSGAIRGLSVRCMWHVGWVSPIGCTSIQIVATLRYE
jgi:hypothetical protein